jgi:hypothetical protein
MPAYGGELQEKRKELDESLLADAGLLKRSGRIRVRACGEWGIWRGGGRRIRAAASLRIC